MAKVLLSKKKEQAIQQLLARGTELHRMGRLAEAELHYREVLEVKPRQVDAQHLLGVIRAQQGRLLEALELIGGALPARPDSAAIQSDYGLVLHRLGRHAEALVTFDRALRLKPDDFAALGNRGNVLASLGRLEEAVASYDGALKFRPHYAEVLSNRGHALAALGRYDEAVGGYRKALMLRPGDMLVQSSLANALAVLARYEEALVAYDAVLAASPGDAAALTNRGNTLLYLSRHEAALESYERALAINPRDAMTLNNRGSALKNLKRDEAALASYDAAIAIRPDFADALYNRANLLKNAKRYDEALVAYDRARAVDAEHPEAFGAIDAAQAACEWGRVEILATELRGRIEGGMPFTPFALLALCDDPLLHWKCATNYAADRLSVGQPGVAPALRPAVAVPSREKIRIAYLSSDFHEHATAYLIAGLIEQHDRSRFDVVGISFGPDDGSEMRRRLTSAFHQFFDVQGMSDHAAAALLTKLDIDIAVDLKGYTKGYRSELLRGRPAPIQVNYLGYPGTMGADFIDYVLADVITVPFEQQPFYTEKIVHLPECYQVNDDRRLIADQTPTRREAGLPEQGLVFCCFNNTHKIAAPVFDIWMRLLEAVPASVLWLLGDNAAAMANLRRQAQARGVDPARLVFATRCPLDEHLARHRLADLFLDTLPYNAHTTASDALWAGLAVLTCQGQAFAGRVAASLLQAVGLPELITTSLAEYEAVALRLATDQAYLAAVGVKLAHSRLTSTLFDTRRFTRHIEAAYETMWEIHHRGEAPRNFAIETAV